jgi:hypothetical protein
MSVKTSKDIKSTRLDKRFPVGREAILLIVKEVESGLNRKEACARYEMAYAHIIGIDEKIWFCNLSFKQKNQSISTTGKEYCQSSK